MTSARLERGIGKAVIPGALLLLLGASSFVFATYGQLHVLLGACVLIMLTLISMHHPDKMLLVLVAASILMPLDLAFKAGTLPRVGPTRVLMAAVLLGMLARHVLTKPEYRRPRRLPFLAPIALYLAFALASALQSVSVAVSLNAVIGRELLEQFILFYILFSYLEEPGFWPALRATLYAATVVVCLYAFVEFLTQSNPLVPFYAGEQLEFRAGLLRCRSTFAHPIALGCYLNIIAPIVLADLASRRERGQRAMLLTLLGMMAVAMQLTVSRVPWICFAAILVGFFLLSRPDWRRAGLVSMLVLLGIVGFAALYVSNSTVNEMFKPFVDPSSITETSSAGYRLVLIESVLRRFGKSEMLLGYGPNAFHLAGVTATFSDHTRVLTAPDLHYVRLLFEYGLAGLIIFMIMLGLLIRKCIGLLRRAEPGHKPIVLGCLLGIVIFVTENFTVSMFSLYPLGMLFWMLAAVAFHFGERRRAAS